MASTTHQPPQTFAEMRQSLARMREFATPFKWSIRSIILLTLIGAAASATEPLVLKFVLDHFVEGSQTPRVLWGIGALLAIAVGLEVANGAANWLTWKTRIALQFQLTTETVSRLHVLPVTYHRQGIGATMSRIDRGIQGLVNALSRLAFEIIPAIAYIGLSVVAMAKLEWRLMVVVLVLAPIPAVIAAAMAPKQARREHILFERWARIYGRFNEVMYGLQTVRSFAKEDVEKTRFLRDVDHANRIVVRGVGFDTSVAALQKLVGALARIIAIAVGGYLIIAGETTIGTLVAFLGYIGGLFGPVQALTGVYSTVRMASAATTQVFSILDEKGYLEDAPDATELRKVEGHIVFEDVWFGYDDKWVLRGIDLELEPGETVALVGPSGAGKTTIMSLVQRFFDASKGRVLIDGKDVRSLQQKSLRDNISVVLQDALLFNDTIRNNIAYGRPSATEEEVLVAAMAANVHEFVSELPEGYDTRVGERGAKLSAGQRQRIAIARAILKDAPILMLDEPTSALDTESESLVQQALDRVLENRTGLIIAHRLSTVARADRILVLREGRIVEQGPHAELLRRGGVYASLVEAQNRGIAPFDHTIERVLAEERVQTGR